VTALVNALANPVWPALDSTIAAGYIFAHGFATNRAAGCHAQPIGADLP